MPPEQPRIGYWIFNFEPKWEAASREVQLLRDTFGATYECRMITLNLWGGRWKLWGRDKHLPLPGSLVGLPWIIRAARRNELNHVFASPGERFLMPWLARLGRTVLTISKQNPTLAGLERNIEALKELRCIVVESERYRDLLLQVGVAAERIRLIYPGVRREPYRPATGPFTILFATSPRKDGLVTRGIYLMIRAAERLPHIRFRLVWRSNPEQVMQLLEHLDLPNVELVTGFVEDMKGMYDAAHAVILPALEVNSLKPCPHSGLHALAHGKPLLVSECVSISDVVGRERCGVIFEPTVDGLCRAIEELRDDYDTYQSRAQPTRDALFTTTGFVDGYAELYGSLLGGGEAPPARRGALRPA